jgi:hypothetical protein
VLLVGSAANETVPSREIFTNTELTHSSTDTGSVEAEVPNCAESTENTQELMGD